MVIGKVDYRIDIARISIGVGAGWLADDHYPCFEYPTSQTALLVSSYSISKKPMVLLNFLILNEGIDKMA